MTCLAATRAICQSSAAFSLAESRLRTLLRRLARIPMPQSSKLIAPYGSKWQRESYVRGVPPARPKGTGG